jgi:hypothetical protein
MGLGEAATIQVWLARLQVREADNNDTNPYVAIIIFVWLKLLCACKRSRVSIVFQFGD